MSNVHQMSQHLLGRGHLEEISARVETAKTHEVLTAQHTLRRGYRNAKDWVNHICIIYLSILVKHKVSFIYPL